MRRFVLVLVTALLLTPIASAGGPPSKYREFAQGANVFFTNCPLSLPTTDRLCHDYSVWYVRFNALFGTAPLGSLDFGSTPFVAQFTDDEYVLHPDGSADELRFQAGSTTDVSGSYDRARMTTASMSGATIQMNDIDLSTGIATPNGRTVVLGAFTWTAGGKAYVFGNDGPVLGEMPRHSTTRCETVNSNFHQRFTLGDVSGTVDGIPISTYNQYPQVSGLDPDASGAIFNNWFRIVDLSRGCV